MSSTSPAVGAALDVLTHLASRPGPVGAAALARELGLPRSTTYHLLQVLADRGFVVHLAEERAYGLGVSTFEVGSAYLRQDPLERLARPLLARLVEQVGRTAHLGVLHGAETVYLVKEQPPVSAGLVTAVGVRLPAHLTATGLSLLAHLPAAQVRALFPSRAAFLHRTAAGPSSLPELRAELARTRSRGWAEERGLVSEGFRSVAAAAFDHGSRPAASVGVTWRGDEEPDASLVAAVRAAAAALTRRLTGTPPGCTLPS